MNAVLFWMFSAVMLFFGLLVILHRNPVASALSLVASFLGLAALYVCLDAYFIGVIQILVYAGAVMVLFLFIIMLLDLRAEQLRRANFTTLFGGAIVSVLFLKVLFQVSYGFHQGAAVFPPLLHNFKGDVWLIGMTLFEEFKLPLQVVGALILVASIGVVLLSKRELK